ncbi:MAG: DUF3426 domain-containing protein [Gallionellaceae bacterium]|nr:DUF3426 domain-containing protein [Gallionellaceae bacterium]
MLTTCPECQTTFRLSHAQLEARRGLVRCGYCRAVFNAYDTLLPEFETPAPAQEPETVELVVQRDLSEPVAAAPASPEPEAASPIEAPIPGYEDVSQQEAEPADEPEGDAFMLHLSERVDEAAVEFGPPPVMPVADGPDAILLSDLPTRAQLEPEYRPSRKLWLGLLNLVLVLLLLAQAVYFLRGPLVAWLPELRPGLTAACETLGCRIPLDSDIGAIRVESSSLETDPEQANRATLRVSFSNRSQTLQQWPHFVLKLTDWQGGPLAQRAFGPADYLAKDKSYRTGMAPMSEHEFHLDLDLGGLSASGYEVLARYP